MLSNDGSTVHPVEGNQKGGINFSHLRCLDKLTFHIGEIGFFVIRNGSDILKQFSKLWRKDVGWKQFLRLNFILVLHHLLEAFLVGLVPPWKLTNSEIAEQKEE